MKTICIPFPWSSLLEWYREYGRHDLPWREYGRPEKDRLYRVWLSEILLQQTQVERVRGYFSRILERFPTLESLADASYEEFFLYYQWLGYYSRARNILKTAGKVRDEYDEIFPREKSLLMKLPGVWWYTSSAILAFGYGESYLAWDTNLEKVFSRYYNGRKDEKLTEEEKEMIEQDFRVFCSSPHSESWMLNFEFWFARGINNALMDFASILDLKNPTLIDWEKYPIRSWRFYETKGSLEPIEVKKSQSFPLPDARIIVFLHKDHKVYYSEKSDVRWEIQIGGNWSNESYSPFILPPPLHRESRQYIQEYFRNKYSLELSVRPPHKKWISDDGKPYIAVNAQIQAGEPHFEIFTKKEISKYILP
jgi:A/G-specific adenine glycosylase